MREGEGKSEIIDDLNETRCWCIGLELMDILKIVKKIIDFAIMQWQEIGTW